MPINYGKRSKKIQNTTQLLKKRILQQHAWISFQEDYQTSKTTNNDK